MIALCKVLLIYSPGNRLTSLLPKQTLYGQEEMKTNTENFPPLALVLAEKFTHLLKCIITWIMCKLHVNKLHVLK